MPRCTCRWWLCPKCPTFLTIKSAVNTATPEHLLRARPYTKRFMYLHSFDPHKKSMKKVTVIVPIVQRKTLKLREVKE